MSLIHKALKKAEGPEREEAPTPPVEEFIGKKPGLKEQLTPRTIVLLVIAILAFAFLLYKKTYHKTLESQPVASSPAAQLGTPAQQLPSPTNLSAEILVDEAKKFYGLGKIDEALSRFLEASLKNPASAEIFNNIGLIYKKKNDMAQAENYYRKALAIKPDYAEALNNLGVLKANAGEPLDAAIYLKKALAINSTYADAYFNLAVLNDGEGNFREAIVNYKSFLQYTDVDDENLLDKIRGRIEQLSE